ncbi:tRNA dihydrouridine synthase DusB [Bacteroidetes bacterium endosymbiont of Geopemphigus sp.]|uniref:tRNA dihydrouridine synthase DusB n=1 Tax=Bacteroidetes bacterium endosymbiont of Geopemphigus sp. TaxID=2047937 RepID=UPI000CD2CE92|nr:tRNA dihydrouridine synthase DusB [Bacteroidetes bacterium endosymbiont of Geopemphigus sp.]
MVFIGDLKLNDFPLILAPMEDVSDPPFRRLCKEEGADLMFTEFISIEGLIRHAEKSVKKLDIFEYERPIGIQIFGAEREAMIEATEIINEQKPDIIDINFGCPVKKVVCKGAGAAILKDIDKMISLAKAVVEHTSLPVTVKTRLGWDEQTIKIEEVAERLQDVGILAISIHGRTRAQMYKGKANWSRIATVKNHPRIKIPIFGNGDVDSPEKALEMKDKYGLDGVMIGRAAIGYPWIFREIKHFLLTGEKLSTPSLEERINAVKKHLRWTIEWKGERLGLLEMRRHYGNYFKSLPNIKPFRQQLIITSAYVEVMANLEKILATAKEFTKTE